MPYIDINVERIDGYYLVIRVLVYNIPHYWKCDVYKLGVDRMN